MIAALALLGGGMMLAPGQAMAGEAYRMVSAHFFCHTAVPFELMHQRDAAGDDLGVLRVQEAALAQKACGRHKPGQITVPDDGHRPNLRRGARHSLCRPERRNMRYRGIAVPSFVLATRRVVEDHIARPPR